MAAWYAGNSSCSCENPGDDPVAMARETQGSDAQFTIFWQMVTTKQSEFDVEEPALPRRRRAPARLDQQTDRLKEVLKLYGANLEGSLLKTHLKTKSTKPVRFSMIRTFLIELDQAQLLLSEVVKLMKLILVMPATKATSEHSFSALKRVKTYLRSSMTQTRSNHLMLLHVHKEITDSVQMTS
ncbi:uncharacterized protein LOC135338984 [Halichondria panicea]|uniref:uncharacterized protein LOC135338984 n=1 Tax=Halichondria panicea TaxID=6063 RepID=UPI00312BA41B